MNDSVTLFEVGPRDGLQNEKRLLTVDQKVDLVNALSQTGLTKIETGSFVSPKWIPQMASSNEVFAQISRSPSVIYSALTPNLKGFEAAIASDVDEVAIFAAVSESFSQKNINCSIEQSLERFEPIMALAREYQIPVRGYLSCVMGCPYEGNVSAHSVANLSKHLYELGCYEISLGDTIGVGNPRLTKAMLEAVTQDVPVENIAIHCHDTYGRAIANICTALELGVRTIDSSVSGLGGCPYAKGASGNVSTEDVIDLLDSLGLDHGVNLEKIIQVGQGISAQLERANQSRVAKAYSN